ncbi:uncharacterized protein BCR38DRAFT_55521 [Pseudomassariella vexata]|uniref:Uncharacterized protein n=1 Tax=Pseudomassariella vexata TaxID=1141098 RepID=A0A1Y2DLQ0_9PEZI|nr:uncharacterized protein BCR38DRAFT_55521 [Pseudomassariella vexata]ORY60187.1 hypothetical protein BCR38DRAFT_55521 [Pseudomassariella vexata]
MYTIQMAENDGPQAQINPPQSDFDQFTEALTILQTEVSRIGNFAPIQQDSCPNRQNESKERTSIRYGSMTGQSAPAPKPPDRGSHPKLSTNGC